MTHVTLTLVDGGMVLVHEVSIWDGLVLALTHHVIVTGPNSRITPSLLRLLTALILTVLSISSDEHDISTIGVIS